MPGVEIPAGMTPLTHAPAPDASVGESGIPSPAAANRPLVNILIEFTDVPPNLAHDDLYFETMMFGPRPSLRDYYEEITYGKFSWTEAHPSCGVLDPGNDGVWPCFYLSAHTQAWGVANVQALAAEAMLLADPDINYALHDTDFSGTVEPNELTINIITSGVAGDMGGGSPWSHMWNAGPVGPVDGVMLNGQYSMTSEYNPMGTTAHELGHQVGLPDLYDTDGGSDGIGNYGLMGGGSWCGPTHPIAWSKWMKGWIVSTITVSANGYYDVHDVETTEDVYRLWRPDMGPEEFWVENRWKGSSYDGIPRPGFPGKVLPDEGLLITHLDWTRFADQTLEEWKFIDVECMDSPSSHFVDADDLDREWNRGDATDLWGGTHWSGNHGWVATYDFHGYSTPCDSKLYAGGVSRIDVRDIPPPGPTMRVLLSIIEWYLSDWPHPFIDQTGSLDTAFIVGSTAPHGPYNWQAWTADVLGGIGIGTRLGLDAWNDGWVEWFVDTDVAAYAPGPIVTVNWPMITKGAVITIGGAMHYDAEADKFVLVAYGNTAKGTQAACFAIQHYFPFPQQVRGVILRWDDLNGNNFVDFADIPFWIIETWP